MPQLSFCFSFTPFFRTLQVSHVGGKFLLSVNNGVRTLADSIDWVNSGYISSEGSMPTNNTSFIFCSEPGDSVFSSVVVRDYRTGSCQAIAVNGVAGNPIVSFDTNIYTPPHIEISGTDAVAINDVFYRNNKPQNLRLAQDVTHPSCIDANSQSTTNSHALYLPTNTWYIHTPIAVLLDNSVESPASDGGGYNTDLTGGSTLCANVPKTFLNENGCVMSFDEHACSLSTESKPIIVCGSPGENANDPLMEGFRRDAIFDVAFRKWRTTGGKYFSFYP